MKPQFAVAISWHNPDYGKDEIVACFDTFAQANIYAMAEAECFTGREVIVLQVIQRYQEKE